MSQKTSLGTGTTRCFYLAIALGVIYIFGHLQQVADIMLEYVQENERSYLNLNNIAYCLLGINHVALIAVLIFPNKNRKSRVRSLKLVCYIMAALYFIGDLWIISWLLKCISVRTFSFDFPLYLQEENMMFSHLQWMSRNAITLFFNFAAGACWIGIGYYFNHDKNMTCIMYLIGCCATYFIPIVFYLMYARKFPPTWWTDKTYPLIGMDICILLGLYFATKLRGSWRMGICPIEGEGEYNYFQKETRGHSSNSGHSHYYHHHHHHSSSSTDSSSDGEKHRRHHHKNKATDQNTIENSSNILMTDKTFIELAEEQNDQSENDSKTENSEQ